MSYKEINGDLIQLALEGNFDVIAHGCNCFCVQGAGIAYAMNKTFNTLSYPLEQPEHRGDMNKLGTVQYQWFTCQENDGIFKAIPATGFTKDPLLAVANCYTQFNFGSNHSDGDIRPVDYHAIVLCMKKINHIFKGQRIGLPQIGCGLAGGSWSVVGRIIQKVLVDCDVTVVIYNK